MPIKVIEIGAVVVLVMQAAAMAGVPALAEFRNADIRFDDSRHD
ncbi:MAG: hypothetical protein ACLP1D_22825 [Xanthobacteraceae bacterium]